MCYSGKCKYEERLGDCELWGRNLPLPADALCAEMDRLHDEFVKSVGIPRELMDEHHVKRVPIDVKWYMDLFRSDVF